MGITARYRNNNWEVTADKDQPLPELKKLVKYLENLNFTVILEENALSIAGKEEDVLFNVIQEFYQDREVVCPF